eukprot:gene27788-34322_t
MPRLLFGLLLGLLPASPTGAEISGFFNLPVIQRTEEEYLRHCGADLSGEDTCTGFHTLLETHQRRYRADGDILVLDMNMVRRSGLGNTMDRYVGLMAAGMYSSRATFLAVRNCTSSPQECPFDASHYFEARSFDWSWAESRARVAERMEARGVSEAVFVSSGRDEFWSSKLGIHVSGNVLDFLDAPQVQALPWVTVVIENETPIWDGFSKALRASERRLLERGACKGPHRFAKCLWYSVLQPKRAVRNELVPLLTRLAVGAVDARQGPLCAHSRAGFADFAGTYRTFRQSESQQFRLHSAPKTLREAWQRYDALFSNCALEASVGALGYGCVEWSPTADFSECPPTGTAVTEDANGSVPPQFDLMMGTNGTFSHIATCLGRAASLAGSGEGGLGNWSVFVTGDIESFNRLLELTPSFRGHVVLSPGEIGHASMAWKCRINVTTGHKDCVTGHDPGGAWSKSVIDYYIVSLCREVFHI